MGYGGFPKGGIPQITQGIRPSLVDTLEDHLYLNVRWNPKDGWIYFFWIPRSNLWPPNERVSGARWWP